MHGRTTLLLPLSDSIIFIHHKVHREPLPTQSFQTVLHVQLEPQRM